MHAAIRKTVKGGGDLHSAPDLVLVMADAGSQPMNTGNDIESLSPTSEEANLSQSTETSPHDWLAPLPTSEETHHRRHEDVSQEPIYNHWGLSVADGEAECTAAPHRLPD